MFRFDGFPGTNVMTVYLLPVRSGFLFTLLVFK